MALATARVKSLPEKAYYIPEFITQEEEEKLLQKVLLPFISMFWIYF